MLLNFSDLTGTGVSNTTTAVGFRQACSRNKNKIPFDTYQPLNKKTAEAKMKRKRSQRPPGQVAEEVVAKEVEVESGDSEQESDDDHEEISDQEETSSAKERQNPFFARKAAKLQAKEEEEEEEDSNVSDTSDDDDDDEDDDDDSDAEEEEEGNNDDGEDDDDDLIKKLKRAKEAQKRKSPPDIRLREDLVDISMHPEQDLVAASTMDGELQDCPFWPAKY